MALTYLPMLLQQDVNKLYPDILNFDITPPPHWNGRVSHTFFLKRRWWFLQNVDFGWDKLLDYMEFNWNKYWLVKDWTDIKLRKNNSTTTLFTGTFSTAVNHRILLMSAASWTQLMNWTWATSNVNAWVYTITDSTKTWTVNAYAWKYIYIQTATTWQWQVFKIQSNTATVLTLARWREVQPVASTYYIFDSFAEVPWIVASDWLYAVHNDTSIYKQANFWTVIDAIYTQWRLMCVDTNSNVIVSYEWYNSWFIDQTSIIWTYSWVKSMVQFQDFILMLSDTRIWIIKKISTSVLNGNPIDTFKPVTITNLLWAFSAKSFAVYNQWLYLFTSAKRFVAITITPAWTDRYTVTQEDQWMYIQQFLDSIDSTYDVSIAINAEKIVIASSNDTIHNFYLYDTYYKFRYRWNTLLPIHWLVVFNDIYFLWDILYTYDKDRVIDNWNNDYIPYIRVIFWESDIFSLKNVMSNKIYIWKNTNPLSKIKRKLHLDWWVYTAQTTFEKLKYLSDVTSYWPNTAIWNNILWYWIFGWSWITISDYVLSWINVVEIPVNFTCTLMEMEVLGNFEFWWMMIWYEIMEPVVTPVNSVLWL